jgi:DNA-binding GntR family transcriptional regulator
MDWKPGEARWTQIYEVLVQRISTGEYPPGERLPSLLTLQEEFGVAVATAQKVLRELRAAGLAEMYPGIGTFVTKLPEPPKK